MYPLPTKEPASKLNPREFMDLLDRLVQLRMDNPSNIKGEEIELVKRELTDYLITIDPRQGVHFDTKPEK